MSANSSGQYNTFTVTVNGVTISFKSEEHVTQCKVGSCHDGGNRDECIGRIGLPYAYNLY